MATQVTLTLHPSGVTFAPEFVTTPNGGRRRVTVQALWARVEHPTQGTLLIDTGYSAHFEAATAHWPQRMWRWITPVQAAPEQGAAARLQAMGIAPASISQILITHFHPDHIGGLLDFPNAQFRFLDDAYSAVRDVGQWGQLRAGFLSGLMPADFEARALPFSLSQFSLLPAEFAPFERGYDLFNDGSLMIIPLPGHASGQIGCVMQTTAGAVFLVVDAAWHSHNVTQNAPLHPMAEAFSPDRTALRATLALLRDFHQRRPDVAILPFHCPMVYNQWVNPAE